MSTTQTIDFGIDLGTTNSGVAVCRAGEVRVFQTTDLMNVTPSVVFVSKTGRMLVGKKAYDAWVSDPQNTQAEFKRWMGYNDALTFPASGRQLSAEALSAEVLKSLRADAERATQQRVSAAVITVPAAFGSLQCDATGRAARMAGLLESPLLQEPVAAAVAYGASPASRDQRWMVFDLGGGTLDIAVVSTRNGRLAVLEHAGDNRLGGKDADRLIADRLLRPVLAAQFDLPTAESDPAAHQRVARALIRHAEQSKIALSTAPEVTVDLFDLGSDADGNPIEATLTLRRADVEGQVRPVVDQCLALVRRALVGARLAAADLDRVLLVGGPTQMPIVRAALEAELGAKLDYSLDPMTVVARGAALYASTLERTTADVAVAVGEGVPAAGAGTEAATTTTTPTQTPMGTATGSTPPAPLPAPVAKPAAPRRPAGPPPVKVELAYERASGTLQSPVAGVIDPPGAVHEVKVDAGGGFWTSGWVPVVDGCFQVDVMLQDGRPVTAFELAARAADGAAVAVTPAAFAIAYMLPMSAPPLPHTIAIELSVQHGVTTFDPVFPRHTPLPAETRKTYRADRTLKPSEVGSSLPVKFWEVEVSDDPQEKWWAGCVHVRAEKVRRPIPEGAELELTIRIDASRKMSVEVFVPSLNQPFANDVYVPDPPSARSQLQQQLDLVFARLEHAEAVMYEREREEVADRLAAVREQAEEIVERVEADRRAAAANGAGDDPDAALAPTEALRTLRVQLAQVEDQLGVGSAATTLIRRLSWRMPELGQAVTEYGTEVERLAFAKLTEQYDRYMAADDARGLAWVDQQAWTIKRNLIWEVPTYWRGQFNAMNQPGKRFLNKDRAGRDLADGAKAIESNDLPALRSAVFSLWENRSTMDAAETDREQSAQSGLRS